MPPNDYRAALPTIKQSFEALTAPEPPQGVLHKKRGSPVPFPQEDSPMQKYVCSVCGYEYDPAENDNVPFDQLPDDWCCPVCGVSKDQFNPA